MKTKPTKPPKAFRLQIPIYDAVILVQCGGDRYNLAHRWACVTKIKPNPPPNSIAYCYWHQDAPLTLAMFFSNPTPYAHEVAHESAHAAMRILQAVGTVVNATDGTEEPFCYLMDYIVQMIGRKVWA